MYIDEKLIKILEPHLGEEIDVSYAISLIKTISNEYESEQLRIGAVSNREQTQDVLKYITRNSSNSPSKRLNFYINHIQPAKKYFKIK